MAFILLDQNAPKRLASLLQEHDVRRAFEMGWSELSNGELIAAAEGAGFQVLITADKNLQYQQSIARRSIAIVVLETNRWAVVRLHVGRVLEAIETCTAGGFTEVKFTPVQPPSGFEP